MLHPSGHFLPRPGEGGTAHLSSAHNGSFLSAGYALASSHVMTGGFPTARQVRDALPAQFGLTGAELAAHGHYTSLSEIAMQSMDADIHFTAFSPSRVLQVQAIADNSTGTAGIMAMGLLNTYYGYEYDLTAAPSVNRPASPKRQPNRGTVQPLTSGKLKARPNPADELVTFDYLLPENAGQALIEVYDTGGQLVRRFEVQGGAGSVRWHTDGALRGVYYCKVVHGGEVSTPLKIVLLKQR